MSLTVQQLDAQMPDATQLLSDEPEMESSQHYAQLALLVSCLEWHWRGRDDFFIGANLTVYYSRQQLRQREFRGPDFFLVRDTPRRPRTSWVVWEEDGRYPDLIIELLSESTARVDRTVKKTLYQDRFRTPEYFWFSPVTLEFEGFQLINREYGTIEPNEQGWRWSQVLGLFLGVGDQALRFYTAEGERLPTPEEAAERARQEQAMTQQQLEQERQRAQRLAERLRALGIDPDAEG